MSIIYDALKKVENTLVNVSQVRPEKNPKPKPKSYLLVGLVVCSVLFIANILIKLQPPRSAKKDITLEPLSKAVSPRESAPIEDTAEAPKETPSSFTLNGVYFSGGEGYALINNRIVKEGDIVDGATVVQIFLDEVELERDGSIIKLSNSQK